jgi:hypothetical protein
MAQKVITKGLASLVNETMRAVLAPKKPVKVIVDERGVVHSFITSAEYREYLANRERIQY